MSWPHYRDRITVVDALEAGACLDGVTKFVAKNGRRIAAPTSDVLASEVEYSTIVDEASFCDGYGSGSGSCYGDGYGSGSGDGDGSGYGDGDGSCYGDGYGSGSGDGDGSGYGYG